LDGWVNIHRKIITDIEVKKMGINAGINDIQAIKCYRDNN